MPVAYLLSGAAPERAGSFFLASVSAVMVLGGWAVATALRDGTDWRFEALVIVGSYLTFGVLVQTLIDGFLDVDLATNFNAWGVVVWPLYVFALGECGFHYNACG